ncbi:TPM domain-containing protein [Fibrobacter sp.]|uniref:TPM domain-containing protein n=1 Tax=Fibrobacter sp. TaxID=35828 RepID=UPI0038909BEC
MSRLQFIILVMLAFFAASSAAYHPTIHHSHNTRQHYKTEEGFLPDYPQYTSIYSEHDYLTAEQLTFYHRMTAIVFHEANVRIISAVIEKTGNIRAQGFAKDLATAWKRWQKEGRYIFIFHFVDEKYTYIEIGDGVKHIITEETLDSLRANIYEPKLQRNRIGEGILGLAHSFAETFYQKELKKPFEINKVDIPEEGNHIYHDLAGVLFFLMFAGVLVIFTAAYKQKRKKLARK